ncbi:MAG: M14 family metallopeptidase [Candidatus Eremiobacteraeota bacterium]|nr:M14 family metallopeptidase [Candidatus Eremiobacteraeota bacterium]
MTGALIVTFGICAAGACTGRARPVALPLPIAMSRAGSAPRPRTRAERTGYAETSHYADVVAFVDSLAQLAPGVIQVSSMGTTTEGRAIPLVIASRPAVATPDEARRLGRPVVYVQANIHAGEVEGKEALQMLLRDLALAPAPNVLDSLVLLAVPIYNADGNERFRDQSINRTEQNGPALVGQRANAQGLDLNRDYVKAEAPETRAALALFARWDPDAFVDLHTTDGSYHGYALTWSPSLHPSAPLAPFNQDTLLPMVAERVRASWSYPTFPYGNFAEAYGADVNTDTTKQGWYTYDSRARFGTNYYGLRGRVSVLSEAFSHDPFERRVHATYAFVREVLSALAADGTAPGYLTHRSDPGRDTILALRTRLTPDPRVEPVLAEDLARAPDSARTVPGVPRGLRRTGHIRTVRIPVYDRFVATRTAVLPHGGWAFAASAPGAAEAVALLQRHGIRVERLDTARAVDALVFRADSVITSARPFQGHHEVRLEGAWQPARRTLAAGSYVVPARQLLALLAAALLEPEDDDGLVTWNVWDAALKAGADFPVVRIPRAADVP